MSDELPPPKPLYYLWLAARDFARLILQGPPPGEASSGSVNITVEKEPNDG